MGEYIRVSGVDGFYKLGTCENLYYARYTDLVEWVRDGRATKEPGNEPPAAYLDGACRFRFPFPDEDNEDELARLAAYCDDSRPELHGHRAYKRGIAFEVPATLALGMPAEHLGLHFAPLPGGGLDPRGRVWTTLPCPQAADRGPVDYHYSALTCCIEVVQQRPLDGQLWTVCRCGYCETLWRLPESEARELAAYITATRPEHAELARRICAGYDGLDIERTEGGSHEAAG